MTEPTTFDQAIVLIKRARNRTDLFGTEDPAHVYRRFVKLVHPDAVSDYDRAEAKEAFLKLQRLWSKVIVTVKAPNATYELGEVLGSDELADYLAATCGDGPWIKKPLIAKLARRPTDNDLFRREVANLKRVTDNTEAKHLPYLPVLVDSFPYRDPSGVEREIVIYDRMPNLYSLATVLEQFPSGMDARHVAWIWRRLYVAIGLAHHTGVIYGAVVPDHILIEPDQHGLILSNWCYSAARGQRIPAIVKQWKIDYPSGILRKEEPTADTDIRMASNLVLRLLEKTAPMPLIRFAQDCPDSRMSAWKLLGKLDDVLSSVYGPRKFTPFPAMPRTAAAWPLSKG